MPFGRGPEFWLVAGSNGAGKTTLTTAADIRDILGDLTTINPDAIAKELIASGTVPLDQVDREAVEGAERKVAECIERRENFLVETVLSTDKYLKHVRHAKEVGYSIGMLYMAVPNADVAVERVAARVARGGHSVPEAKIRDRWVRSHRFLGQFLPLLDRLQVFANLEPGSTVLVGQKLNDTVELLRPGVLPEIDKVLGPHQSKP